MKLMAKIARRPLEQNREARTGNLRDQDAIVLVYARLKKLVEKPKRVLIRFAVLAH